MACSSLETPAAASVVPVEPNQPTNFAFPKRKFGVKTPTWRSFQASWFKRWSWLTYDQNQDKVYCFSCVRVTSQGKVVVKGKTEEAFTSTGYCNWKDATIGFQKHECSQVGHVQSVCQFNCTSCLLQSCLVDARLPYTR